MAITTSELLSENALHKRDIPKNKYLVGSVCLSGDEESSELKLQLQGMLIPEIKAGAEDPDKPVGTVLAYLKSPTKKAIADVDHTFGELLTESDLFLEGKFSDGDNPVEFWYGRTESRNYIIGRDYRPVEFADGIMHDCAIWLIYSSPTQID
jgi:hypothetical protein